MRITIFLTPGNLAEISQRNLHMNECVDFCNLIFAGCMQYQQD